MKTIDLTKETRTVAELLDLARSESVFIHAPDGGEFLLEEADEFGREARTFGRSEAFMSLLQERSEERGDLSASQVAERLGIRSPGAE